MRRETNVFLMDGRFQFNCNDCGQMQRIDDKTECSNCGAWYEMEFIQTVPGVDPFQ